MGLNLLNIWFNKPRSWVSDFIFKEIIYISKLFEMILRNSEPSKIKSPLVFYLLGFIWSLSKEAYFFCRIIDDWGDLDTQLPIWQDFENLISHFIWIINWNEEIKYIYDKILLELIKWLSKKWDINNVKNALIYFLKSMLVEYNRHAINKYCVYTFDELRKFYIDWFSWVIDISLILSWSINSSLDLQDFCLLQWKIYSIRDLELDIRKWIINIPKNIIEEAWINDFSNFHDLISNPIVIKWIKNEILECEKLIDSLMSINLDKKARKVIEFKIVSIGSLIERLKLKYSI